jgi:5-methylcytosine-specific restriction endonuclease McrA
MTWIKLDDTLPNNPKILPLSDKAFRLYIEGLCYANQYLTDGFLAQAVINRLDSGNACQELLDAGLWLEVEAGMQIHDYCEHQTSRKVVEEKREQTRKRLVKHRAAKAVGDPFSEEDVLQKWGTNCHICNDPIDLNAPRHSKSPGWKHGLHLDHVQPVTKGGEHSLENVRPAHAVCNLSKNNHVRNADETHDETRFERYQNTETETETETDKRKDLFDDFWKIYPLKVGKGSALKAFLKAVRTTDADIIIQGATRYKLDPNRSQAYTAHAATWLNAQRWLDEALPTRNLSPAETKEKELQEARIKSEREKEEAAKWFKEQEEARRNAVPPPAELRELLRKSFGK